jgi:hypothetical protein
MILNLLKGHFHPKTSLNTTTISNLKSIKSFSCLNSHFSQLRCFKKPQKPKMCSTTECICKWKGQKVVWFLLKKKLQFSFSYFFWFHFTIDLCFWCNFLKLAISRIQLNIYQVFSEECQFVIFFKVITISAFFFCVLQDFF